jgi:hypothetical protein
MVNAALQSVIEALSVEEHLELVEYVEHTLMSDPPQLNEKQKATIRSRGEDTDPAFWLTSQEFDARMRSRLA